MQIVPLTLVVCFFLLYASFRWFPGMFLPVVAVGVSAVMVLGAMAFLGVTLNVINNVIPPLLIIIGVCDSIHLIGRYREELEHATSRIEAAKNTVRAMAVACFLTSITTSVGLALAHRERRPRCSSRFGVIAGIGVLIAYVVTIGFSAERDDVLFKPPKPDPRAGAVPRPRRGWTCSRPTVDAASSKRDRLAHPGTSSRARGRCSSAPRRSSCSACSSGVRFNDHASTPQAARRVSSEERSRRVRAHTRLMERPARGRPAARGHARDVTIRAAMAATPRCSRRWRRPERWLRERDSAVLSTLSLPDRLPAQQAGRALTDDPKRRASRALPSSAEQVEALMYTLFEQSRAPTRSRTRS